MCSFEWIGLHFPKGLAARRKAIFRRLAGGKSREINTETQPETPKMRFRDFGNTL